ncbi:MAG: hypothetical protein HQM16_12335 [Deltaproteobacteria bacterium]|nr:hypothetical protein [Deltaproteobacteria bacterium]
MTEMSHENIGILLRDKDPDAVRHFMKDFSTSYYTFCFRLCLENDGPAGELFVTTIKYAVKKNRELDGHADIWFYQSLHKVWAKMVHTNKKLREQTSEMKFDWSRRLGRQQEEALKILNPLEREIVLYRYVNGFALPKIAAITGLQEDQVTEIFSTAVGRIGDKDNQ